MTTMVDIVGGAIAAVIGTPQRIGSRVPSGVSPPDLGDEAGDHAGETSPPSPEAFAIATPTHVEPAASEAGSGGSQHSSAEAMHARLDAANEVIAQLNLQLGEARAQLAAAMELRDMAVKMAVMETRLAAQAEVNELKNVITSMRAEWAQWEATTAAAKVEPEENLIEVAPGLGVPSAPAPSQTAPNTAELGNTPTAPTPVQARVSVAAPLEEADHLPDAWALSRAAAGAAESRYPAQVREGAENRYPVQARETLKDLHPKDVPQPAPYKGDSTAWLDWSAKFRRYAQSRSNRSLMHLLEKVELLRGDPVKPSDERAWETDLDLAPSITEYKERLYSLLEPCTTGPAGLIVSACGVDRVCDAWRQLADAGCSLRAENMLGMMSKIMMARSHVPDKELQGYMTKWERDLEFYAKATGTEAVSDAQHKMIILRMCSVGLHTHLGYTKATEGNLATIRQEIANWLHRVQNPGKGGGLSALEEAYTEDASANNEDDEFDVGPEATQRLLEEDPSGALLAVVKKGLKDKSGGKGGKGGGKGGKGGGKGEKGGGKKGAPRACFEC